MRKNLRTKFVGMDVHQKSISIAIADDGPDGEVRIYGTIRNKVKLGAFSRWLRFELAIVIEPKQRRAKLPHRLQLLTRGFSP